MQYLNNLAQHNPQMANIMQMVQQFATYTPEQQEQFIANLCQQKGINLENAKQQYQQFLGGINNQNGINRINN